jgi:hypothetical protein
VDAAGNKHLFDLHKKIILVNLQEGMYIMEKDKNEGESFHQS